jgi:hypothetical protein
MLRRAVTWPSRRALCSSIPVRRSLRHPSEHARAAVRRDLPLGKGAPGRPLRSSRLSPELRHAQIAGASSTCCVSCQTRSAGPSASKTDEGGSWPAAEAPVSARSGCSMVAQGAIEIGSRSRDRHLVSRASPRFISRASPRLTGVRSTSLGVVRDRMYHLPSQPRQRRSASHQQEG